MCSACWKAEDKSVTAAAAAVLWCWRGVLATQGQQKRKQYSMYCFPMLPSLRFSLFFSHDGSSSAALLF
jgi:hypothetical protein